MEKGWTRKKWKAVCFAVSCGPAVLQTETGPLMGAKMGV